ncbi:MAG: hypothetical protein MUO85_01700, partial [candidate division Zixibacteria bacterium]|nr:hypothetical protein [candidate division Zixibacteria bacterium]
AGTVDLIGKTIKYIFDLLQEIALLVNEKLLEKEYLKKQYDKLQEEEQVLLIAKNNNVNIQDRPKFYERKSPEKSTGQIVDCSS